MAETATTATKTPTKPASRLGDVVSGRIVNARRRVISGPEGVGKSTLVAAIPDILFIDVEGGSDEIDVSRYKFRDNDKLAHVPKTWNEVRGAIRDLTENPSRWKAVALDTLDRLEALATRYCLNRDSTPQKKMTGLESYGYNKGPQIILDEMMLLFGDLDRLRNERGIDVYITAHVQIRKAPNPSGEEYERWDLKAGAKVAGFVMEWADDVGFMHFVDFAGVNADLKTTKVRAWSSNDRVVEWDRSPTWRAKARTPLPPRVEIPHGSDPWAPMQLALERAAKLKPADLIELIDEQLARLHDDTLTAQVRVGVDRVMKGPEAKAAAALGQYLHALRRRDPEPPPETTATTEDTEHEET